MSTSFNTPFNDTPCDEVSTETLEEMFTSLSQPLPADAEGDRIIRYLKDYLKSIKETRERLTHPEDLADSLEVKIQQAAEAMNVANFLQEAKKGYTFATNKCLPRISNFSIFEIDNLAS